ncbi:MAG: hypothetical protein MI923_22155, partial [Phycisphaerales bacterium]|nr:hypothetical protein [Phycisphaerales bacterium]
MKRLRSLLMSLLMATIAVGTAPALAQPCTSAECPPGTIALEDSQGNFAGWCVSASVQGSNVSIVTDLVDFQNSVAVIEISKEFQEGPAFGVLPPVNLDFVQVCPDAETVSMIVIADEVINNNTGEDWTSFEWIILDDICAWFDVSQSSDFNVSPFLNKTFSNFIDAPTNNQSQLLTLDSGIVPNGAVFFPGAGTSALKIGVNLSGDTPVSFTLKEQPFFGGECNGSIAGCVICLQDDQIDHLEGITVRAFQDDVEVGSAVTDANGQYTISGLDFGDHT